MELSSFSPTNFNPKTIDSCPLCASTKSRVILSEKHLFDHAYAAWKELNKRTIDVKRCENCSFAYSSELPKNDFFQKILYNHPKDLNIWLPPDKVDGKEFIINSILHLLQRYQAGPSILDLGANSGRFLYKARSVFSSIQGIENDPTAAALGKKFGIPIVNGSILEHLPQFANKINTITLIDVLEHLPDPLAHLTEIYKILPEGGLLYIKVPHQVGQLYKEKLIAFLGIRQTTMATNFLHINHFSEKSLRLALEKIGFKILHAQVAQPELYPEKNFFINCVRLIQYYFVRILRQLSPINLGLNLEILARKG